MRQVDWHKHRHPRRADGQLHSTTCRPLSQDVKIDNTTIDRPLPALRQTRNRKWLRTTANGQAVTVILVIRCPLAPSDRRQEFSLQSRILTLVLTFKHAAYDAKKSD